ncbi:hypothetical protein BDW02DRAFT_600507 [Decorospora gaudefroyi]|uniref:Uncharacterized protein n=1 Tax=Decorospora gaudefroyi TaxID=184978 RepID=A0A6A5K585_9PLEO|nr:hypothetical protein BDW02DRAFT_600507 [Decorospora gaudefroyi]
MKYDYIMATIMLSMVAVKAAPSGATSPIEKRDKLPKYTPFTECIRNILPNFPAEGKPSAQQAKECLESSRPRAKREEPEDGVLIWEPEEKRIKRQVADLGEEQEKNSVQPRKNSIDTPMIVDKLLKLGKPLNLATQSRCRGKHVNDDFLFSQKDIGEHVHRICRDLTTQIENTGIQKDGGIGFLVDKVTNGHDKQGHQLKDKKALTATYLLTWYPPYNMVIEDIKTLAGGVTSFCNDAIRRLGSPKDEGGCTQKITYFRPSKAKTYKDLAQIGGDLEINWDGKQVGTFSMDFSEDG